MRTGRTGTDLVFGRTPSDAFVPSTVRSRATEPGGCCLEPIKLHECRHTAASILIDAGINNPKAIMEFMGHSTITETYDRYGHLMPGNRDEVRARVDAYSGRVATRPRLSRPRDLPASARRCVAGGVRACSSRAACAPNVRQTTPAAGGSQRS